MAQKNLLSKYTANEINDIITQLTTNGVLPFKMDTTGSKYTTEEMTGFFTDLKEKLGDSLFTIKQQEQPKLDLLITRFEKLQAAFTRAEQTMLSQKEETKVMNALKKEVAELKTDLKTAELKTAELKTDLKTDLKALDLKTKIKNLQDQINTLEGKIANLSNASE